MLKRPTVSDFFAAYLSELVYINEFMNTSSTRPALRGSLDALPLFIPALPFAFVFGVVVVEAGIPESLGWSSSPIFLAAHQVTLFTRSARAHRLLQRSAPRIKRATCSPCACAPVPKPTRLVPGGALC